MNNFEPRPCRHCGGFCGDSGPTCDERYDAAWSGEKTAQNNQAAQTMPELPIPWQCETAMCPDLYTADQMHQYASDYAASQTAGVVDAIKKLPRFGLKYHKGLGASTITSEYFGPYLIREDVLRVLSAAPAASGVHPDALPDGTLSKSTAKRVTALAAESVSERARALMAQAYRDGGFPRAAGILEAGVIDSVDSCAIRAIEQALTQKRGEQLGDFQDKALAWDAVCDALGSVSPMWGRNGETGLLAAVNTIRSLATTTPQPSADAVREVIGSMLNFADVADKCELTEGNAQVAIRAWATQLESLLSGGSHA